jgi:predicted kinase
MKTLFIIRGVSGSGKSYAANAISSMLDACGSNEGFVILAADDWFDTFNDGIWEPQHLHQAHEWCRTETKRYLQEGYYVCVCNTFTTEKEIAPYRKIAADLRATFVSLIADTDGTNTHNVPVETLQKQAQRFKFNNRYMQETRTN